MSSQYDKEVRFTCAVRGFHHYRRVWDPVPEETLRCYHERNNLFDRYAIKTVRVNHNNQVVGHLPLEVSRISKFLLDRGAEITAQLITTNYRRSPLVQGGLEIPCIVVVKLPGYSARNHLLLERYDKLVRERYAEPKNEEIIGSFMVPVVPTPVLPRPPPPKKAPKRKSNTDGVQHQDIRTFFAKNTTEKPRKETTDEDQDAEDDCIVID